MLTSTRIATGVDWAFAPTWLTISEACWLSGHDRGIMRYIVDTGGVDISDAGLVEKASLWEFQQALAEILHWYG